MLLPFVCRAASRNWIGGVAVKPTKQSTTTCRCGLTCLTLAQSSVQEPPVWLSISHNLTVTMFQPDQDVKMLLRWWVLGEQAQDRALSCWKEKSERRRVGQSGFKENSLNVNMTTLLAKKIDLSPAVNCEVPSKYIECKANLMQPLAQEINSYEVHCIVSTSLVSPLHSYCICFNFTCSS